MRQWNVNPKMMCRQHLLGEHVELHMFRAHLKKGHDLSGYISKGYLSPTTLYSRHEEVAKEMLNRGYQHWSPMESYESTEPGGVDVVANEVALAARCERCNDLRNKMLEERKKCLEQIEKETGLRLG